MILVQNIDINHEIVFSYNENRAFRNIKILTKNGQTPLRAPQKIKPFKLSTLEEVIERMLTMEPIYCIRNMRKFEGKSLRKISQPIGHDFEIVKKYI
jgi:hypothetical protein